MEIKNFVLTPDTAVANGSEIISASAVIMNGNDYVSNEPVVFSITSGSAFFSNNSSSIVVSSNSLGAVSASLADTTAETVVVEIALQSDAAIHDSLAATFTQSDNSVDTISLLLTIDDAKADGEDQNQVELQTLSGAVPVSDTSVSLTLTNGAVFISGENTAKIKTDSNGRASLPFTSTTAGQSKLTAYLDENIAVYNSVTATFVSASPELALVLDVVSDNAQANGNAVNRVRATVTDSNTQKPLSGQTVAFSITGGSAVFDNDSTSYSATTDSNGEAYASVKDEVVESVSITAVTGGKTATATVHFSQDYAPLKIERVYNVNQTFPDGGPTVAWRGAEFSVVVSGGSGSYSWSVTEGSDVLSVISSSSHTVTVGFEHSRLTASEIATFKKTYTIKATDDTTGETVSYSFSITLYFTEFGELEYYANIFRYPSHYELLRLYDEWGNMRSYPKWVSKADRGAYYWTNEVSILLRADLVNVTNGSIASTGITIFGGKCMYAGKSSQ